jgi:hypothetical protein
LTAARGGTGFPYGRPPWTRRTPVGPCCEGGAAEARRPLGGVQRARRLLRDDVRSRPSGESALDMPEPREGLPESVLCRPIGTVLGGRTQVADDDWDRERAVIRLDAAAFGPEALLPGPARQAPAPKPESCAHRWAQPGHCR